MRADSLMRIVPREAGILLRGPAQYIDVSFSSADLVLKMDDFAERIIRREMGKLLAEQVDRAAMYSLWRSYLPTAA